jgi:hypothetical protein
MRRFTLMAALLAVGAAAGRGGPAGPAERSPGAPDAEARRLLEQFDRLRTTLHGSSEPLRQLDEGRRLLGEAQTLLDEARERLAAEHQGKAKQLEQEALALQERRRQVVADWVRLLADPRRGPPAAHTPGPPAVALRPLAAAAERAAQLRLVIGSAEALSAPAAAFTRDPHTAAATPAPVCSSAGATRAATNVAPFPAPAPWGVGVTADWLPPQMAEQKLDSLLDRLEGLERRLGSLPAPAEASCWGPSVTVTNPPSVTGSGAALPKPDVLTASAIAKASATQAKAVPRTTGERRFEALLNAVEGMEKRLAELEKARKNPSD